MTTSAAPTPRSRVRRNPVRARYGREVVDAVLDVAPLAHVSWVADDGAPRVVPVLCARTDDVLVLHGSSAAAWAPAPGATKDLCVAVTLLDGLVLARSTFHHSANYRAVVVHGRGRRLDLGDDVERTRALRLLDVTVDHLVPGRSAHARGPSRRELAATCVVELPLDEASAKVREGGPVDDDEDLALDVWAGVLPLRTVVEAPEPDAHVPAHRGAPAHVAGWTARWSA